MNQQKPIIGIIGGGQLGRMMSMAAANLGYQTCIFSDQENCPASFVTNKIIIADYEDEKALNEFCQIIDIATFEFENIPTKTLEIIAQNPKDIKIYPDIEVLRTTQDRQLEKDFLSGINTPVAPYRKIASLEDLQKAQQEIGPKTILKTARMGYDGKGQEVLDQNSNLGEIWQKMQNHPLVLEKFIPFAKEISIIIARNEFGEIKCYEPLENQHKNSILDISSYPANIDDTSLAKAQHIAVNIAIKLELIGIMAIEFFVLEDGELLVNELAPRPHNSGHFSMDAAITSQFEQCIRAICSLPLASTKFHSTGSMINLIGQDVEKAQDYLANGQAKIHLYQKEEVKKGRKMGHINLLDSQNKA